MKTDTTFDHWDTTPTQISHRKSRNKSHGSAETIVVPVGTFQPEEYTSEEWQLRQSVERAGDDMWKESSKLDFGEFEGL
ncbi:conserved hypothetical protein [Vibrio phage 424E50-1]|nr:conserved hypothetical protein [Vibrio phage 424E50-1]